DEPVYYTEDEYLDIERSSDEKHEYVHGEIVAMTGGSPNHNQISGNVITALNVALRDTPCIVYTGDMQVKLKRHRTYRYPDVAVVCDEPQITDDNPGSLLNPVMLVEVLSESTQITDRGDKLREYTGMDSVQAYLLVAQDEPRVEVYLRQESGWLYHNVTGLDSDVTLTPVNITLPLAEVYRKVTFERESDS
ncbi:MAG: Uma2 family endonuclease, partial [Chloroflexota bacterium]